MLNVFDNESSDIEIIRRQRISTRVYLLVFSISVSIVTIYTIFSNRIEIKSFSNPSQDEYNNLLMINLKSFECPCKDISIEYKYFIEINTTFHAVCSSDFVSREWRDYLFYDSKVNLNLNLNRYERRDIRARGSAYFVFLSALCNLSQTTIHNAINQFLNETFLGTQIISESEFDTQINNIISQFQNDTLTKFSRSLKHVRDIINGNAFVSSFSLNWYWPSELNETVYKIPINPVIMNDGCSCGTQSDCIDSGGIYHKLSNRSTFVIPGWNVGCSVVETLLHSTFECFYNDTCLDLLLNYAETVPEFILSRINISIINSSNESRFKSNTIIQKIADELFVEEWKINTSYSLFYKQCAPKYCSYKIQKNDYLIATISKILGLYGGLTTALRFSIPLIIKIIFKIRDRCRRNTVTPSD